MKALSSLLVVTILPIFLSACCTTHKNLFVLMSDPDGNVGQIIVTNKGGSEVIAKPGYATEVENPDAVPSKSYPLGEDQINKIFGAALAAQPELPVRYILFYFNTATTELMEDAEKLIPEILSTIEARKSTEISIVGHTDRVGSRQDNYKLGLDRAASIKEVFVSNGVDSSFIEISSHGEDNPFIITEDEVEQSLNRRVEVTVR